MTEEQLRSMSEQEIRTRFQYAPAYYLQAMLEKKQAQRRSEKQAAADARSRWQALLTEQSQRQAALLVRACAVPSEPERLDLALPGFDILDAALSESGHLHRVPAENGDPDPTRTQQSILETALEDYSNWPMLADAGPDPVPESVPESELERKLRLLLDSTPELEQVLDAEPGLAPEAESSPQPKAVGVLEFELDLILESEPELELALALESDPTFAANNVTTAEFGQRAPRTVPVVSVVMDRKRPNMVRVIGKTTRLAG